MFRHFVDQELTQRAKGKKYNWGCTCNQLKFETHLPIACSGDVDVNRDFKSGSIKKDVIGRGGMVVAQFEIPPTTWRASQDAIASFASCIRVYRTSSTVPDVVTRSVDLWLVGSLSGQMLSPPHERANRGRIGVHLLQVLSCASVSCSRGEIEVPS